MANRDRSTDVVIIGGGIMGLAQAWSAAESGQSVTVLERGRASRGASIRNFGMVWPIGQPPGERLELAFESAARWTRLAAATNAYARPCGSLFAATAEDEAAVMAEFAERGSDLGYRVAYLDREAVLKAGPLLREDKVIGGLQSETEINVDPPEAIVKLSQLLTQRHGVAIEYQTQAIEVIPGDGQRSARVRTHDGRCFTAGRVLICQGDDAAHLFPDAMREIELVSCKLHMLATPPIDGDMGPMLATGLTMRHYESFRICRTLPTYRERIAAETEQLDRYGIHVMASQGRDGRLILGDSHQYGDDIDTFHAELIDDLILEELSERIRLPAKPVAKRWQGYYLKRRNHTLLVRDPATDVRIVNGLGGNGMTMSFGIAAAMWRDWSDPRLLRGLPDGLPDASADAELVPSAAP